MYNDAQTVDMGISQISKSSSTDLNKVIDTTEDIVSEVDIPFTAPADTDGVSNLNIQDSISDVNYQSSVYQIQLIYRNYQPHLV